MRLVLGLALALLILGLAQRARAADCADARSCALDAVAASQKDDWRRACELFEQAVALGPDERILYNRAYCYGQIGRRAKALWAFEELETFLEANPAAAKTHCPLDAAGKSLGACVPIKIAKLKAQVSELRLLRNNDTDPVEIKVDGQIVDPAQAASGIRLDAGDHLVERVGSKHEPFDPWSELIVIRDDKKIDREIVLPPLRYRQLNLVTFEMEPHDHLKSPALRWAVWNDVALTCRLPCSRWVPTTGWSLRNEPARLNINLIEPSAATPRPLTATVHRGFEGSNLWPVIAALGGLDAGIVFGVLAAVKCPEGASSECKQAIVAASVSGAAAIAGSVVLIIHWADKPSVTFSIRPTPQ